MTLFKKNFDGSWNTKAKLVSKLPFYWQIYKHKTQQFVFYISYLSIFQVCQYDEKNFTQTMFPSPYFFKSNSIMSCSRCYCWLCLSHQLSKFSVWLSVSSATLQQVLRWPIFIEWNLEFWFVLGWLAVLKTAQWNINYFWCIFLLLHSQ